MEDSSCGKCKKMFETGEKAIYGMDQRFHESCFVCHVCSQKIAKLPTELELGTAEYDGGLICRTCWVSRKTAAFKNIGKT